ncbi:MACPF domain-containing protein At4g24290-like [Rhodamnia argentea]|uniref:MACPF domain-containing protein At4g24290-like n=1 Tax=Rhodamnia argentea TaxID=178133 RepID=A0A8B8QVY4_9MYRT|nr:MACPF domain-containing protein At4g24290-like [Rhodamnia argentea]XP_030551390.2 MACPF domain-containing protein At4g24290-like [Rhodamnia argentea]
MGSKALDGAREAARAAVEAMGLGYDLTVDLRLRYCKKSRLVSITDDPVLHHTISIPGVGISIPNVPTSVHCDKGERMRFSTDVLSFQQMSEQFNQALSLSGKIPTGHFNAAFDFRQGWQIDAANTKTLAFDGVFITLYNIQLRKSQLLLSDYVKQAVPSTWDPAALARFIRKYGTHVIVGVKMGGNDVIYAKQQHASPLQPADVQKKLKEMADKLFIDGAVQNREKDRGRNLMDAFPSSSYSRMEVQDIVFDCKRKGGNTRKNLSHSEWSQTVIYEPDVVSMTLIPIASMLSGIHGSGFLSHAINLYLRYKPPIDELHQFLEFQLPKQWAPVFGELALGPDKKQRSSASLQLSFMGPKLYVNTTPVDVGKKPVTGLRLYLEGKRGNCLAIHLQHLSSVPQTFQLVDESNGHFSNPSSDHRYYEKVQWKSFSHVCTAPVQSEEDLSIVTGAHFEVRDSGLKKVLFLRLYFSKVIGAVVVRRPEWADSPASHQKSGIISTLISTRFSTGQKQPPPKPSEVNINSAVYPGGPPVPSQTPKLLRFIDTTEMTRGPQDSPGYWVVSGARLQVDKGKISLRVKYSLLTVILPDEEADMDL